MKKNEATRKMAKSIFITLIILAITITAIAHIGKYVKGIVDSDNVNELQNDMLRIQAKVEITKGKFDMNNDENPLKGKKLSEYIEEYTKDLEDDEQNENTAVSSSDKMNKFMIKNFQDKEIISSEDYSKYYILKAEDFEAMELHGLANKHSGYFMVNYENFEVIYTGGYENKNGLWCYKISDLNKMPEINVPEENNQENNDEEKSEESEQQQESTEEEKTQEQAEEEKAQEQSEGE